MSNGKFAPKPPVTAESACFIERMDGAETDQELAGVISDARRHLEARCVAARES